MLNKEERTRIENLENSVARIEKMIEQLITPVPVTKKATSTAKKSSGKATKTATKKATKCTYALEEGKGNGVGKMFIAVTFDGKPTQKVLDDLKLNGFRYFAPDKKWSAKHTDKREKFAKSLVK